MDMAAVWTRRWLARTAVALALAAALVSSVASAAFAPGERIAGRVVGVQDSDTLTLLTAARAQIRVRLAEIDAPESGQPYGSRAKQALSEIAFGQGARLVVVDTDRYGRTVARVVVGATDVNAEMVRRGAAWVFLRYARDPSFPRLEAEARAARRGLWALPAAERVAPWEWWKRERERQRR
jgi:endonuclease YncB( thermonuclease family)